MSDLRISGLHFKDVDGTLFQTNPEHFMMRDIGEHPSFIDIPLSQKWRFIRYEALFNEDGSEKIDPETGEQFYVAVPYKPKSDGVAIITMHLCRESNRVVTGSVSMPQHVTFSGFSCEASFTNGRF